MKSDIVHVDGGKIRIELHPGQTEAWDSQRRFIFAIAGTQGGKTSFGPWWLNREIHEKGPGDYLAVTATYDLFKLKMLPEIRRVFAFLLGGWVYQASDRVLYSVTSVSRRGTPVKSESRIILRSANSPGGLESATALGAWLDECGQEEFKLESWEATLRRLSLSQGRVLGTTTPYNLGWLKTLVYDRWVAGDPDYHVIQFKSIMNPAFPVEEYERARRTLPGWKFEMFYNGQFSKPAGLIYDVFGDRNIIPPFEIPAYWPRYGGLDFGGVNTAAVGIAADPDTTALYMFSEYLDGGQVAAEHARTLKSWKARTWVGGAKSEGQWRREFAKAGMPIKEPEITEVEVGIDRVYGAIKSGDLLVFSTLARWLDEVGRYSRKLDDFGQPTEEIKDKSDFHLMDATRYIVGYLRGGVPVIVEQPEKESRWIVEQTSTVADGRWKGRFRHG